MEGIDWINLTQDRYRWQASVNMVMNLQVPYNGGTASLAEDWLTSQKGLCSMK